MDLLDFVGLAIGGLAAGALSTVAGMGGGLALVAVLSLVVGPHVALATTAPALLVGNLHRTARHRHAIDRPLARQFAIGALPGAIVGGVLSVALPELALSLLLVAVNTLALLRAYGRVSLRPRPSWMVPVAFGAGTVAATSRAGVIVAPLLVAGGLSGEALVATGSFVAVLLHVGRIAGYGVSGLLGGAALGSSLVLATFLVSGNHLGERLRARLGPARCEAATRLSLFVALGLGVLGVIARSGLLG
ncbi:MAG: sulfite exporter TauE/SafE family protein [Sandaracinaceae bacterium]|nr:sulfite exporter TauE/SafE family protein [Sandaracinaceae bacterium]